MTERIIALVDMDCFYCQVETKHNPTLTGLPMAVVQYNAWKGGGIIAVNYEARDKGVTRHMRGDEAKKHCPEIILVTVPTVREKADLTRYRDAGREVIDVMCTFSDCVERASIDEAYIDLTSSVKKRLQEFSTVKPENLHNTFIVGYNDPIQSWLTDIYEGMDQASINLAIGAAIIEEMRQAVFDKTGYHCSAGIAHNKILAKLACGLNKPKKQTVLPHSSVGDFFSTLPLKKVRNLGGKLGIEIEEVLSCKFMGDLLNFTEKELINKFEEKTGSWLYNIARGLDSEPVTARLVPKSIGCCKKFPGKTALAKKTDVEHWLGKLTEELLERLLLDESMNKRKATHLVVSTCVENPCSKSVQLPAYNYEKIFNISLTCLKKFCVEDPKTHIWSPAIKFIGLSAGKFNATTNGIQHFFKLANKNKIMAPNSEAKSEKKNSNSFFEKILLGGSKIGDKLELVPSKELMEVCDIKKEKTEISEANNKMKKEKTIINFFKESTKAIDPNEIFPDLNEIDEETLSLFPVTFQKKVREIKKNTNVPSTSKTEDYYSDDLFDDEIVKNKSTDENNDTKICSECGESLSVLNYNEHLDYHLAKKLQNEFDLAQGQPIKKKEIKISPKKDAVKRKSKALSKNATSKKMKSLDSFFQK